MAAPAIEPAHAAPVAASAQPRRAAVFEINASAITAPAIAALVALGMALAFVRADPDSPTSRALAVALAFVGLSIVVNATLRLQWEAGYIPSWAGPTALIDMVAFMAGYEWIRRVRRTIPAGTLKTSFGDWAIWVAQGLVLVYVVLSLAYPEMRVREFIGGLFSDGRMLSREFLVFALPLELSLMLAGASLLLCLNRRPDLAERVRLIAFVTAIPFIASGLVLPFSVAPLATVIGLLIVMIGAMRYHVLQGRRGLFLSRFLSPQVLDMVRRRGLKTAMQDDCFELSIVCCDLRGFTSFAREHDSDEVIAVLRAYYDRVGEAVTEYEGTVKDYAGDGVLVLVGAPLRFDDHAQRAVGLAESIVRRWRESGQPLAVGVGVATGPVTVGIVGGAGRLEYAAVGSAVNLASRLCEEAGPGEVLVAAETAAAITATGSPAALEPSTPRRLKGFAEEVPTFALRPA
jgi:class 3 adenylate cyclase